MEQKDNSSTQHYPSAAARKVNSWTLKLEVCMELQCM